MKERLIDRLFKTFSKVKPFKFDREEIYKERIEKILKEEKNESKTSPSER